MAKENPDYIVTTGDILMEYMQLHKLSTKKLAYLCGITIKDMNNFLYGKTFITKELAENLEKIFNVSASYWIELDDQYKKDLENIKLNKSSTNNK